MNLSIDLAVQKSFLTYLVDISRENIVLEYLYLNQIIVELNFLTLKAALQANPYLVCL